MIPPPIPRPLASFYTPEEVAEVLRVTPATVRNMIRRGHLHAIRLKSGRGLYRIPADSFHAFIGEDKRTETRSTPAYPKANSNPSTNSLL